MTIGTDAVLTIPYWPELQPTEALANALIEQIVSSGTENYQEDHFDFTIDGENVERTVVVTISFKDRPSPHELRLQAEEERDRIAAQAKQRDGDWRAMVEKLVFELEEANNALREQIDKDLAEPEAEAEMCEATDELVQEARAMLAVEAS
jgi:hypothetical protein